MMKETVKKIGYEDGRELFNVTIRKNHAAEDYAEMVKTQESSNGKRRFIIRLEGFNEKEAEQFFQIAALDNYFRNVHIRNDFHVTYSNIKMYMA